MRNLYLLIFLTVILCMSESCIAPPEEQDTTTFYRFSTSDKKGIINFDYVPNQIIIYENQFGEKLQFKVISNVLQKESEYNYSYFFGTSTLKNYYENKTIKLEMLGNQSVYYDEMLIYNFSKSENQFKIGLNFPLCNKFEGTFIDEQDRPTNIRLAQNGNYVGFSIVVNGKEYKNVTETVSPNTTALSYGYGLFTNNTKKIFYAYDSGVIQFEDVDGKIWKII